MLLSDPKVGRVFPGCWGIFDEMGVGKTKQLIDAACELHQRGEIDSVIVITPAACRRGVWTDEQMGELRKHLWDETPARVTELHGRSRTWRRGPSSDRYLNWVVTNYEYLRSVVCLKKRDDRPASDKRRQTEELLLTVCGPRTILVIDESSAVKSHRAKQTKATNKLRKLCGRVVEFNGTPIDNSPADAYSQAAILDPRILGVKDFWHFLGRYAVKGGYLNKEVVAWHDLDDIRQKLKPYVLRREKQDCLDLPPELEPVTLTATLLPETWRMYKSMRDDFLTWLSEATLAEAAQAGVRAMRLAQITSGFLGGVKETAEDGSEKDLPDQLLGSEKLHVAMSWIHERLEEDQKFKLLIWCRFRHEIARLSEELRRIPGLEVANIWGGQTRDERARALHLLDPGLTPDAPVVVVGTPAAGALGLNLTASHHILRVSRDYRLATFLQGNARIHRTGQTKPCWYGDIVAEGPRGQRTIDHVITQALRDKQNLAEWTCAAWRAAVEQE